MVKEARESFLESKGIYVLAIVLGVTFLALSFMFGLSTQKELALPKEIALSPGQAELFNFTVVNNNAVWLNVGIKDGNINIPILYGDENNFLGTGGEISKLTVSTSKEIKVHQDDYFVLSVNLPGGTSSYLLSVSMRELEGFNVSTIRNVVTGENVCEDKRANEVCNLGGISLGVEDVFMDANERWVMLSVGSLGRFDVLSDTNGNYISLPAADLFPISEYLINVSNKNGDIVEIHRFNRNKLPAEKSSLFSFDTSGNSVSVVVRTTEHVSISVPLLYGDGNQFLGTGSSASDKLAVSNNNLLLFNLSRGDGSFVASWNSTNDYESFAVKMGMPYVFDLVLRTNFSIQIGPPGNWYIPYPGGSFVGIGRRCILAVNCDQHYMTGKAIINITDISSNPESEPWVLVGADSGVSFNKLFDANGDYIELPKDSSFPVSSYGFNVYNLSDGKMIEFDGFFWENGTIRGATNYFGNNALEEITTVVSSGYPSTPTEVLMSLIGAARVNDTSSAKLYISSRAITDIQSSANALNKSFDETFIFGLSTIVNTWDSVNQSTVAEEINGNTAKVNFQGVYALSGVSESVTGYFGFVNEGGEWKFDSESMNVTAVNQPAVTPPAKSAMKDATGWPNSFVFDSSEVSALGTYQTPFGWRFTGSAKSSLYISLNMTSLGKSVEEEIPLLYGDGTNWIGAGGAFNSRLATSPTRTLLVNLTNYDRYFVASWSSGINFDSYLIEPAVADGANTISLKDDVSGENICENKSAGQSCTHGNIIITVNNVYSNGNDKWAYLSINEGGSFDKLYDLAGNYLSLPRNGNSFTSTTGVQILYGDLNGDGVVDATDVNMTGDIILRRVSMPDSDSTLFKAADINGDGRITPADLNKAVDIDLGRHIPFPLQEPALVIAENLRFSGATTNIYDAHFGDVINDLTFENSNGRIDFAGNTNLSKLKDNPLNIFSGVLIKDKKIKVDTSVFPEFANVPARITFKNVAFRNPRVNYNGASSCPSTVCIDSKRMDTSYTINVTGFSEFELVESPYCGDGYCDSGETCTNCAGDCGACGGANQGETPNGGGGGSTCVPKWNCTYGACINGIQTRNCVKINFRCPFNSSLPNTPTTITCGGAQANCVAAWSCNWGDCINGAETKTCVKTNSECSDNSGMPGTETRSCSAGTSYKWLWWVIPIAILVAAIAVGAVLLMRYMKRKKEAVSTPISEVPVTAESEEDMSAKAKSLISQFKKRGYSKKEIINAFKEKGWNNKDIAELL